PTLRAAASLSERSVPDVLPDTSAPGALAKTILLAGAAIAGCAIGAIVPAEGGALWALVTGLAFLGGLLSTWSPCGYSSLATLRPWGRWSPTAVVAWLPTLAAHGLGYLLGGLLLGGVLALGAVALDVPRGASWPYLVLGGLACAYALDQIGVLRLPYPQRKAQVPHDVRFRWPMWRIGLFYGFALGLNFVTYVRTPILYLVVGAALLSGSAATALLLVLAVNLGRFLPLLVNAFPVTDRAVQQWLAEREQRSVVAGSAALALVGTTLIVDALLG
ncbi:MAG: methylamine utilization protein MauF, partial [Geminicoccaceae bacterium]|nr:methylamine utilization protein MauF [Geminicoccaceae bacterium]